MPISLYFYPCWLSTTSHCTVKCMYPFTQSEEVSALSLFLESATGTVSRWNTNISHSSWPPFSTTQHSGSKNLPRSQSVDSVFRAQGPLVEGRALQQSLDGAKLSIPGNLPGTLPTATLVHLQSIHPQSLNCSLCAENRSPGLGVVSHKGISMTKTRCCVHERLSYKRLSFPRHLQAAMSEDPNSDQARTHPLWKLHWSKIYKWLRLHTSYCKVYSLTTSANNTL